MSLDVEWTTLCLAVGLIGQALFSARFLVQWLASERARRSVMPRAFWHLSVIGGALLLVYALWRQDPVFVIGQGAGLLVYLRNLALMQRSAAGAGASDRVAQ